MKADHVENDVVDKIYKIKALLKFFFYDFKIDSSSYYLFEKWMHSQLDFSQKKILDDCFDFQTKKPIQENILKDFGQFLQGNQPHFFTYYPMVLSFFKDLFRMFPGIIDVGVKFENAMAWKPKENLSKLLLPYTDTPTFKSNVNACGKFLFSQLYYGKFDAMGAIPVLLMIQKQATYLEDELSWCDEEEMSKASKKVGMEEKLISQSSKVRILKFDLAEMRSHSRAFVSLIVNQSEKGKRSIVDEKNLGNVNTSAGALCLLLAGMGGISFSGLRKSQGVSKVHNIQNNTQSHSSTLGRNKPEKERAVEEKLRIFDEMQKRAEMQKKALATTLSSSMPSAGEISFLPVTPSFFGKPENKHNVNSIQPCALEFDVPADSISYYYWH